MKVMCVFEVEDDDYVEDESIYFCYKNTHYANVRVKKIPEKKAAVDKQYECDGEIYGRGWNDFRDEILK